MPELAPLPFVPCLLLVECSRRNFIASTLEQSVHILTFDLVVLDVEMLDKTDGTIYLR